MNRKIFVTGGAGFIGGSLIKKLLENKDNYIYNLDKITNVSDINRIKEFNESTNKYTFHKVDIYDAKRVNHLFESIKPDLVIHLAAESSVDKSLILPNNFIKSNIIGTFNLLEASREHWCKMPKEKQITFKFHHISTDEVFGSLGKNGEFDENSNFDPRSPYSASKASSDHLVSSWFHSYGLPIVITNCSNNYGPYQYPEKLIPLAIINGIMGKKIPLYGDGLNIRDWLFIDDHIDALLMVLENGNIGDKYCIGGNGEKTNKEVLLKICEYLDINIPKQFSHKKLITHVSDRLGHDQRYAINPSKIKKDLGWEPKISFEEGLKKTINWYLNNKDWWEDKITLK